MTLTILKNWETNKQGPFADVPDLTSQLRPRIDQLSQELLAALARVQALPHNDFFRNQLRWRAEEIFCGEGITEAIRQAALSFEKP